MMSDSVDVAALEQRLDDLRRERDDTNLRIKGEITSILRQLDVVRAEEALADAKARAAEAEQET